MVVRKPRTPARNATDAPQTDEQPVDGPVAKKTPARRPRKATAPKEPKPEKTDHLILKTEQVSVTDLHPYYKNPRIGNVEEIAKSLHANGQYRAIVVNVGTHTGRPNEILAGNHTFKGAKKKLSWTQDGRTMTKQPWTHIMASWVDVDDDAAARIVLADNKTAEYGTYDEEQLASIFKDLEDSIGTGYDTQYMQELMDSLPSEYEAQFDEVSLEDMLAAPADPRTDVTKKKTKKEEILERRAEEAAKQAEAMKNGEKIEAPSSESRRGAVVANLSEPDDLDDVVDERAELQVLFEVKEGERYPYENYMGIPVLKKDKLLKEMPGEVKTWAGANRTPDDGQSFYLWNTGLVSMTGLPTDGRAILSFFTHESKYEGWWSTPSYYVAKAVNYGIKYAIMPDFSIWLDDPRALQIYNTYRNFWLGRYMQECGLTIIPLFTSSDLESTKITMAGIPDQGANVIAINLQAATYKELKSTRTITLIKRLCEEKHPTDLIVYTGPPGRRYMEETPLTGVNVHFVLNYSGIRNIELMERQKANKKLTAKEKAAIRKRAEERAMERLDLESKDELLEEDFEEEDFSEEEANEDE